MKDYHSTVDSTALIQVATGNYIKVAVKPTIVSALGAVPKLVS